MVAIEATVSKAWLAKEIGVEFDREYYFDAKKRHGIDSKCNEYVLNRFPSYNIFYSESNLGRRIFHKPDNALVGGIQPNLILSMLLGAEFVAHNSLDADIRFQDNVKVSMPNPNDLLDSEIVRHFDREILEISEAGLVPVPPFFWDISGRATIHGVLTTAQKIFGESIFMDVLTDRRRCNDIFSWIADAYIVLIKHFSAAAAMPLTEVHVGECSACMVSSDIFEEFVVPLTSYISDHLGGVRFHSCGNSTHLIGAMPKIRNLNCLDTGGETSVSRMRSVLGKDFSISIAPLPKDLSADTADGIIEWLDRIISQNQDGPLTITYHLEPDYNLGVIAALHQGVSGRISTDIGGL